MTRQTKASLIAGAMFLFPFLLSVLIGVDRWKALFDHFTFFVFLYLYVLVMLVLFFYGQRGMTWERLRAPLWGKRPIPVTYDPDTDRQRRRRVAADRPLVEAAAKRRDAAFLYRLALEYHEEWYLNEAVELLRRAAALEPAGPWGADARAKLREWGQDA